MGGGYGEEASSQDCSVMLVIELYKFKSKIASYTENNREEKIKREEDV